MSAAVPSELDPLLSAISDAIEALVAWDIPAFQSAVERQSAIRDYLAVKSEWRQLPGAVAAARKIHDLNRVYDRLLQHSVHWTRIVHTIMGADGGLISSRTSVHFRA
jgi:hypothetical protein